MAAGSGAASPMTRHRSSTGSAASRARILAATILVIFALGTAGAVAQTPGERGAGTVNDQRITRAALNEPGSWLSYGLTYEEQRFSRLDQINRTSVAKLGLSWVAPLRGRHRMQATPLVIDGVLYVFGFGSANTTRASTRKGATYPP